MLLPTYSVFKHYYYYYYYAIQYSYYYKNDTESALDVTLSPADIAASKGLQITYTPGGKPTVNGHIPGYTKLNVYKIYGDVLHLNQQVPEKAPRAE